ncbi:MAG TPA: ABC transporter permease [Allosphingosinicella sp.]|jgi:putative ABC transport system permease protein|uniref:ABC transporter permease n=1 Tax=Allosphingosinicella sp. TaxID=2823234 RepID=UPI002F27E127
MWRNNLLLAVRLLARHRIYSAINIGGLALGLAACLLILGYIRYERNYDSWLPDHERVYQVQTTIRPPGQPVVRLQASSYALYERLGDFPQIEAATSVAAGKTVTDHGGRPMFLDATTVDSAFFDVFALPFAQGSAAEALPDLNSIVVTESDAMRLFGRADVLGKTLSLGAGEGKRDYRITGVLRDLPRDSSLRVGIVYLRDPKQTPPEMRGWGAFDQHHYAKLRTGADAAAINAALPAWEKRVVAPEMINGVTVSMADVFDFRLVPLTDVHLGEAQERAIAPGGDTRSLATFGIIAALILAMAVMNFVNLTTARATLRAREVAVRKLLGASRGKLVVQFFAESALIAAAATLIGLAIVELATPWMGAILGADLPLAYFGERGMLAPALALLAFTAVAGGLYPALHLSRFKPARVLRANQSSAGAPGAGRLRAVLVVVQFAIAIGLIASTAIVWSQTRFVERVDPGYARDGLVQIDNAWRFTQGAEYEAARRAMLAIPGVTESGRTGLALGATDKPLNLMRRPGADQYESMGLYGIDADFLRTMRIDLLAGRLLGDRVATDRTEGLKPPELAARGVNVVVNRSAAAKFGFRAPRAAVGQAVEIAFDGLATVPARIVGVVEDTRFRSARDTIEPLVYTYDPTRTHVVLVRYASARPGDVMAALEEVWRRFEPELPFEARFADDIVRELYAADRARTLLFAGFSALAIVIACLGLYSLAAFATERRTKEIGIRKVFGATVRDIVRLLAWQFSKPVVLANLIAWPIAWWVMRDWLNTFDARIALTPGPFVLAGLLALTVATGTVAGHAIRVARTNPIHALRYE